MFGAVNGQRLTESMLSWTLQNIDLDREPSQLRWHLAVPYHATCKQQVAQLRGARVSDDVMNQEHPVRYSHGRWNASTLTPLYDRLANPPPVRHAQSRSGRRHRHCASFSD